MVLVEENAGKQNWYRVGDLVGDARIEHIEPDWIGLSTTDGEVRLYLRGDTYKEAPAKATSPAEQPPREVSRSYRFVNLISRVYSAVPGTAAQSEQLGVRSLNEIFGLAERAKITAINRIEVSTVSETRAALRSQLLQDEPIRIAVDNAYTKVLYVIPER